MTGPLSVLLIIGAATIGPIEAQRVEQLQGPTTCSYTAAGNYLCITPGPIITYETLPQLCERAMREIGAEKQTYKAGRDQEELHVVENWWRGFDIVRCIPTPTGYRK